MILFMVTVYSAYTRTSKTHFLSALNFWFAPHSIFLRRFKFHVLVKLIIICVKRIRRCELEDILLEMDRILRPEGSVLLRDKVDVLNKVKKIAAGMRWDIKLMDHEEGPLVPEKILVAVKQYWVGSKGNSTSTDDE